VNDGGSFMIVKEEFLNKLRQYFHLNLYEVKIWTALLSRGVSTAGELSDIGDVPRSRAYDILESLEKKGFVVMKLGKPIKYIAVEPKEVIERVKKFVRRNAESSVKRLDELRGTDVLKELDLLHKQGIEFIEPTDLSGAVRGRHNLYAHLETMLKNANKQVTIMATEKGIIRKIESLRPVLEKLKRKGVDIKIAAPLTKENKSIAKDINKIGELRHIDNPEARFCIVDGKEMMFMLLHDEKVHPGYDVGVWVNTPFFASAVQNFFDRSWKTMTPIDKVNF
jgi:HTH-type transcriptional regulator, sugar sensing transcriptional regulator